MADLGDSPTLNPMQGYGNALFPTNQVLGFEGFNPRAYWDVNHYSIGYGTRANSPNEVIDKPTALARFNTEMNGALSQVDKFAPNLPPGVRNALGDLTYNAGSGWMNAGLGQAVKAGQFDTARDMLLKYNHAGGQVLPGLTARRQAEASWFNAAPLSGPQQSYSQASNLQGSGDGTSGQAGQKESSYNSTPYNPGPQGTVMNTGAPTQNSGEIVGQGTRGWNIYQTTPSWTGSPLSQAPEARDEGDFKATPPISGPQNPLLQRQAQIRQLILQNAMANIPRGYQFKLG